MFGVAILYTAAPHSKGAGVALVALLAIYFGAYGGTIGPLSWVTAGEMSSNRLRSLTFGAGMAVGFIFAWLTTFTTPYFINPTALNWGAKGSLQRASVENVNIDSLSFTKWLGSGRHPTL